MNRHYLLKKLKGDYIWWSLFGVMYGFSFFVPEEYFQRYLGIQIGAASSFLIVIITEYSLNNSETKLLSNQYQRSLPVPWFYSFMTMNMRVLASCTPSTLFLIQAKIADVKWLERFEFYELLFMPGVAGLLLLSIALNFRLQIINIQKTQNVKKKNFWHKVANFEMIGLFMLIYTFAAVGAVIGSMPFVLISGFVFIFILTYNNYKWWVNRKTFLAIPVKVVSLTYLSFLIVSVMVISFLDVQVFKMITGRDMNAETQIEVLETSEYKGVSFPKGSTLHKSDLDDFVMTSTLLVHKKVTFPKESQFHFFKNKLASVKNSKAFKAYNFVIPPFSRFFGGEDEFTRIYISGYTVFGETIFNSPIKVIIKEGRVQAIEVSEATILQGFEIPKASLLIFDSNQILSGITLEQDLIVEGMRYPKDQVYRVKRGQIQRIAP